MTATAMIVRSRARPGKREELRAAWDKYLRAESESDPTRLLYLYLYDADDPDAYVLVEVLAKGASPPPPDAPFFQRFMQEAAPLLDGMPAVQQTEVVWSKGLRD
jgi:quinol monooxygenase YgiN